MCEDNNEIFFNRCWRVHFSIPEKDNGEYRYTNHINVAAFHIGEACEKIANKYPGAQVIGCEDFGAIIS